jgi:hypothetical protein
MTDIYRQEDAYQILQLAIARQTQSDELTRLQLLEIADEIGISRDNLMLAEQEWLSRKGQDQERSAYNQYRRHRWQRHAMRYLIVNAFLVLLAWSTTGGLAWSIYILFGWGMLLALDAWNAYQTKGFVYEQAFEMWRRKRWLKKSVGTWLDQWMMHRGS